MYTYKFVFFCWAINHHIALFTFPISSIALVRFQEATFPPTGVFRILIQILPDPAPSSMNSCAKHKFLLLKDKDVFPKQ